MAIQTREFTFDGTFTKVLYPFTVPTRPLQDPLPVWTGARSLESVERAAEKGVDAGVTDAVFTDIEPHVVGGITQPFW